MIFSLSVSLEQYQSWVIFNPWRCVIRVLNQNFCFLSNRFSIWLCAKPDILLTTSIIINAIYLNGTSSSQHSSKNELQSCKNEHSSWYEFCSYVILVSMKLWTQHLTFYIFCNMPYIQHWVHRKCYPNKCNTFFQYHWKSHMID